MAYLMEHLHTLTVIALSILTVVSEVLGLRGGDDTAKGIVDGIIKYLSKGQEPPK